MRQIELEEEDERKADGRGAGDPIDQRRGGHAEQVRQPLDGRHEGVLDSPLPALPGDGEGDFKEHQRQVGPEQRPHQQIQLGLVQIGLPRLETERRQAGGKVADAEHADQVVEEPDRLPQPVPTVEVLLPLDEADERVQLPAERIANHSSFASSSSSSRFPVSFMKASSRLPPTSPAWAPISSAGVPSARTRPWSSTSTWSQSTSASSRSWVQSRTVAARSRRMVRTSSWTSRFERGSRPVVGSSLRRSDGGGRRLRAIATFCSWPRDNCFIGLSSVPSGSPSRSSMPSTRARVPLPPLP